MVMHVLTSFRMGGFLTQIHSNLIAFCILQLNKGSVMKLKLDTVF